MCVQVWVAYKAGNLFKMVDPVLMNMTFPVEEAIRFLTVGLLCVQATAKLRPSMTEAVEMLTTNFDMEGVSITKPGFVADLRNIKTRQQMELTPESSYSGANYGTSFRSSANLAR